MEHKEAYYLGLSPKPFAALKALVDYCDPDKRKQYRARQYGIIDGMEEAMRLGEGVEE